MDPRQGNDDSSEPVHPLFQFPQELLDKIISLLGSRHRYDLMLTCRIGYRIILPLLYDNISLSPTESEVSLPFVDDVPLYTYEDENPNSGEIPFWGEKTFKLDEKRLQLLKKTIDERRGLGGYVKKLELLKMRPDSIFPNQILALTPNLTSLHYDYLIPVENRPYRYRINCRELQAALHQVRATLQRLKITYKDQKSLDRWRYRSSVGGCSLKDLTNLEYLDIPLFILMGPITEMRDQHNPNFDNVLANLGSVLPRSLKHLSFGQNHYMGEVQAGRNIVWDFIVAFVEGDKRKEIVPLKTFHSVTDRGTELDKRTGRMVPARESQLESLCAENGLSCKPFVAFHPLARDEEKVSSFSPGGSF